MNKLKYSGIRSFTFILILALIVVSIAVVLAANNDLTDDKPVLSLSQIETQNVLPEIVVYKSPTCNCCHKWVNYLRNQGFKVVAHNRNDMNQIKASLGVVPGLASCHTATVAGYLIEGHVPAGDIQRLLAEKPKGIVGLTAPGMPRYSPGMQPEDLAPKGYDVLAFDKDGNTKVFTSY